MRRALARRPFVFAAAACAIALAGCASSRSEEAAPITTLTQGAHGCPLGVAGATMTIDDAPSGVVFTFRVPGDPSEIRRRVRDAAAMYGGGAHRGLGHHGVHGRGERHGLALAELPPVRATVAEIEGGARLRVDAQRADDLPEIRARLHERAERVAAGECP